MNECLKMCAAVYCDMYIEHEWLSNYTMTMGQWTTVGGKREETQDLRFQTIRMAGPSVPLSSMLRP